MRAALIFIMIIFSYISVFAAQEANGSAEVEYKGFSPKTDLKQEARKQAIEKAIDTYIKKDMGTGYRKLYNANKENINLQDYVIKTVTISENTDKNLKLYSITVRVEIDDETLSDDLNAFNEVTADERGYVAALFVSREIESVKQFADKVNVKKSAQYSQNQQAAAEAGIYEDENYAAGAVSAQAKGSISEEVTAEGSVESKSNVYTYRLRKDSIFPETFKSEAGNKGFVVTKYDDILNNCSQVNNVDAVWKEINTALVDNPQPKGSLRKLLINCAKELSATYAVIGTVDTGKAERSASTGNYVITATVTGTLIDLKGALPKDIVSGKPVTYKGTGSNELEASTNAIQKAAEEFADYMMGQIGAAGL